jgi:hypothetical protein
MQKSTQRRKRRESERERRGREASARREEKERERGCHAPQGALPFEVTGVFYLFTAV